MTSPQGNKQNASRMTCTNSSNMIIMENPPPFYRQFTWQQKMPQPSGSSLATSPMVQMALFPQIPGRKREPDEDIKEKTLKRKIKNRESAARFRARKLAYIKGLEEEVRRLADENRKLRQEMEFTLTRIELRRTKSALF